MNEEKFATLLRLQAEAKAMLDNYHVVSNDLIGDYKRQARAEERQHIIAYLNSLVDTSTNLYGAIKLLEGGHDKD
jgi:hypothetical protein